MKPKLFFLLVITCCSMIVSAMENPKLIALYGYSHHTDPDGRPSRNDRRYHKENLYLYSDGTFRLIEQDGRLSPEYVNTSGVWDIVDNKLLVGAKEREFTNFDNQLEKEKYSRLITFTKVLNHSISDGREELGYHQGLRPVDLFEKYNDKQLFEEIRSKRATEIFELKLKFCTTLINKQPKKDQVLNCIQENFTIDSLTEFIYYFKAPDYKMITAHLHIETKEIVFVKFFETEKEVKEITNFLLNEKKYEYVGSEHMCDYFNNKKNAIQMCPGMDEGTMIDVSKYEN